MSKLSFRARALDATKPMPVYRMEEVPDLPDFAAINRAVPQMPTGMEKEEESEHHLQRAISAQQAYGHTGALVIPTPEVYDVSKELLQKLYRSTYKHPRQLIHVQPFSMDQDIPDYDMDSEDEKWIKLQAKEITIDAFQFERVIDRLEKSSGQQVITIKEAKLLLKEEEDLLIAVYDYWLNKRLITAHPLIPQVKSEKRDGSTNNNPYVAFRRRTEKMQTRKNRKNDESSYEKMLKLKRDLVRACSLLECVKRRERVKREHLFYTSEMFEKRYQAADFSGQMLAEVMAMKFPRPAVIPAQKPLVLLKPEAKLPRNKPIKPGNQKKRTYKRKTKMEIAAARSSIHRSDMGFGEIGSSDDDPFSPVQSDLDDENDPDGPYAFKRKRNCNYQAPLDRLGNWPWCAKDDSSTPVDKRYRYCLTSLPSTSTVRCIGFARRRIGRGGRVLFDRAYTPLDGCWRDLDNASTSSLPNGLPNSSELITEIKNDWTWYCVQSERTDGSGHCSNESDSDSQDTNTSRYNWNIVNRSLNKLPIDSRNPKCSNQEEFFEMQRKQVERLKPGEECNSSHQTGTGHSFATQPTSTFTFFTRTLKLALPTVIHSVGTSSSVPTSPTTLIVPPVSEASSIRSLHERVLLTNGPISEAPGSLAIRNAHGVLDRFISSRSPLDVGRDIKPNLEVLQASLRASHVAVPSTEQQQSSASSQSSENNRVIHAKTFGASSTPQPELRFLGCEQNGNEPRFKPEMYPLTKIKVEKVNDSGLPLDVT